MVKPVIKNRVETSESAGPVSRAVEGRVAKKAPAAGRDGCDKVDTV